MQTISEDQRTSEYNGWISTDSFFFLFMSIPRHRYQLHMHVYGNSDKSVIVLYKHAEECCLNSRRSAEKNNICIKFKMLTSNCSVKQWYPCPCSMSHGAF